MTENPAAWAPNPDDLCRTCGHPRKVHRPAYAHHGPSFPCVHHGFGGPCCCQQFAEFASPSSQELLRQALASEELLRKTIAAAEASVFVGSLVGCLLSTPNVSPRELAALRAVAAAADEWMVKGGRRATRALRVKLAAWRLEAKR